MKRFGRRWYTGTVVSYNDPYWHIQFDDGDSEDFNLEELLMGISHYGMEIEYGEDYVKLHQLQYVENMNRKFGMDAETAWNTPVSSMQSDEETSLLTGNDKTLYQQLVGSILYLSSITRPDLAFATAMVARGRTVIEGLRSI